MYDISVSAFYLRPREIALTGLLQICSPDANTAHLRDATKSFPSGHTTAAAAGYIFLSLYFNAKMKIFSVSLF